MDVFMFSQVLREFRSEFTFSNKRPDMTLVLVVSTWVGMKCMENALESALVSMTVGPRAGWPFCQWVCLCLCGWKGSWHQGWQCHSQRTVCLSDRPTSPSEYNRTVMSEPSFAMATSHDSRERVGISVLCLCRECAACPLVEALLNLCYCWKSG